MVLKTITDDTKIEDLQKLVKSLELTTDLDLEIRTAAKEFRRIIVPLKREITLGMLITKLYGPTIPEEFSHLIHLGSYTDGTYLENSVLSGMYCFSDSSNATLKNCKIYSMGPFMRAKKPTLIGGEIVTNSRSNTGIAFNRTDSPTILNSIIKSYRSFLWSRNIRCVSPYISSIANPKSGIIVAEKIGKVYYYDTSVNPSDTHIYAVHIAKGVKYAKKIKHSELEGEWTLKNLDKRLDEIVTKYN